jgi:hypothetical protein
MFILEFNAINSSSVLPADLTTSVLRRIDFRAMRIAYNPSKTRRMCSTKKKSEHYTKIPASSRRQMPLETRDRQRRYLRHHGLLDAHRPGPASEPTFDTAPAILNSRSFLDSDSTRRGLLR